MVNSEIRIELAATGVKQYQVADCLGIAYTSFSRILREELPETEKSRILEIIDKLSKGEEVHILKAAYCTGDESTKVGRKAKKDLYNAPFAVRLRALFEENGVKQAAAAEKIGTSRQTIGNWLIGKSQPDFDTLVKLADHFETTTDYLLGRTESKSVSPDLRLAVDYTNLSQRAVQFLHTHVLDRDNLIDFFHLLMGEFIHE